MYKKIMENYVENNCFNRGYEICTDIYILQTDCNLFVRRINIYTLFRREMKTVAFISDSLYVKNIDNRINFPYYRLSRLFL